MSIGNHISKEGLKFGEALRRDVARAKNCGVLMNAGQIFVMGPRSNRENVDEKEREELKQATAAGFNLVAHSSYLSNPWGKKSAFGIHLIKRELQICDEIGARGLVVHLAKKEPKVIAEMIPTLLSGDPKAKLFLEVESYKQSDGTYETARKMAILIEEIKNVGVDLNKIGICMDTAHLWAAGKDISDYASAKSYLDLMDRLEVELMLHLNDQIWAIGSGRDEHAPLGFGTIWGTYNKDGDNTLGESGLVAFLEWASVNDRITILERNGDKPKINSRPVINNIESDYLVISKLNMFNNMEV